MTRASSLGPHDIFLLDQWGRQLTEAFDETPYLVGSAGSGGAYRDVDIRMLAPERLKYEPNGTDPDLMLRVINLSVSLWGRQVTGLPIDFQIQQAQEFHSYDSERRNPMGPRSKVKWRLA